MTKEIEPVVLQILPELETGGVETGTIEIASALQEKGIKNFVASQGGRMVYELEKIGVDHLSLPLKSKNYFIMKKNAKLLADYIRKNHINIVHARSRAPAWSAYWAAKETGAHFVTTFHGTYGLGPWGIKKFYNKIMTYGERVIVISNHIKEHILKNYPQTSADKLRLIHRCADIERFSPEAVTQARLIKKIEEYNIADDKPVLLLPGRMTRWKGQHILIHALHLMKNQNYYCIIAGDSQGRQEYLEYLKKLAHEAFGRISVEGQAMGKIVVASNIGGTLDTIIDGKTGKLYQYDNPQALADALDWALSLSPEEAKKISQAGIKNVKEHFTKQIMCDKTIEVYREVVNQKEK